jgi:hypothetical protein
MTETREGETEVLPAVKRKKGGSKKGTVKQAVKPAQLSQALHLAAMKRPIQEIARAVKLPPSTTCRLLKRYGSWLQELEHLEEYTDSRSRLLSAGELKLFKSMMEQEKLDKASVNNLAYSMRQLYDMGRLERGESTSNVSQQTVSITLSPSIDLER